MNTNAKSRVALVARACDEIGAAIARHLAGAGVQLALAGPDRASLDKLAGELGADRVLAVTTDPGNPVSVAACVQQVLARFGTIDILVNNAGDIEARPLDALTAADMQAAFETALLSPFSFIREVVPGMQRNGYGRVVNVGDMRYLGLAQHANLAAASAALFGLTRATALECARSGVTVNTVVKGDITTSATSEAERDQLAAGIPVKRAGTALDVARTVGFFAADAAKYLTGQTLFVCGGKSTYFSMSV